MEEALLEIVRNFGPERLIVILFHLATFLYLAGKLWDMSDFCFSELASVLKRYAERGADARPLILKRRGKSSLLRIILLFIAIIFGGTLFTRHPSIYLATVYLATLVAVVKTTRSSWVRMYRKNLEAVDRQFGHSI